MAVPPKIAGQRLLLSSSPNFKSIHTIELFLDYVCPFSAKMFRTIYDNVLPSVESKSYAKNVQFVFRQQIQPWHPSSSLVHEAGLAVLKIAPTKFWEFSNVLFQKQTDYFDINVVHEPRNETYKRLAKLGASVGVEEDKMYKLLEVGDKPDKDGAMNIGNGVTDDVKLIVKIARLTGVHVSPTILWNGVVEGGLGSSSSGEDWDEWLKKNCS